VTANENESVYEMIVVGIDSDYDDVMYLVNDFDDDR
jgi:hypothetical protein